MSIAQLVNYYPKYEYLDTVISSSAAKKINIFVDLKGCIQSLYQEWAVRYLIDQSKGTRYIDDALFASVLEFINFHKIYSKKRNIDLSIYVFFERGASTYHLNIYKDYKAQRGNTLSYLSAQEKDFFHLILNRNFDLIENIGNRIPNVSIVKLDHLEADFIPYQIRKYVLGEFGENETDIIYSVDKDMLQCLDNPRTYIFYKHYKSHKIINSKNAYEHYFKRELGPEFQNIGLEWFPLVLSVNGDSTDGFNGVNNVGPAYISNNLKDIIECVGGNINELYNRVNTNTNIFNKDIGTNNESISKILNESEIITRNLKLSSYKLISDYFNGGFPVETIKMNRHLVEIVNNKEKIQNGSVLFAALKRVGLTANISEQTVYNLFK